MAFLRTMLCLSVLAGALLGSPALNPLEPPSASASAYYNLGAFWRNPFNFNVDGRIRTLVMNGSTLYLGGDFQHVGPRTGGGAPVSLTTCLMAATALAPVSGEIRTAVAD